MNQKSVFLFVINGLSKLLQGPSCRGMGSHIELAHTDAFAKISSQKEVITLHVAVLGTSLFGLGSTSLILMIFSLLFSSRL